MHILYMKNNMAWNILLSEIENEMKDENNFLKLHENNKKLYKFIFLHEINLTIHNYITLSYTSVF